MIEGRIADGLTFPEAPRWHDGRLWFSDFYSHRVLALGLDGKAETMARVPECPSGLGWMPDGSLLVVSMNDKRLLRQTNGQLTLHGDLSDIAGGPCNDMVVDLKGRAYVGNFGYERFQGQDPKPAKLARVGGRTNDASDATPELVTRQEGYDTGPIDWRILRADGTPEAVAAAEPAVQLIIGCLVTGMMSGGAFAMSTVPRAGLAYTWAMVVCAAVSLMMCSGWEYSVTGGFLLLYCPPARQDDVRAALASLKELPYKLEPTGSKIVFSR